MEFQRRHNGSDFQPPLMEPGRRTTFSRIFLMCTTIDITMFSEFMLS